MAQTGVNLKHRSFGVSLFPSPAVQLVHPATDRDVPRTQQPTGTCSLPRRVPVPLPQIIEINAADHGPDEPKPSLRQAIAVWVFLSLAFGLIR